MKTLLLVTATLLCTALASQKPKHTKVLILGAGVSGVTAAETLYSKGLKDFLVLEGNGFIGGRIHNGPEGKRYPLGAGQINGVGPSNALWELARKLGLKMHVEDYDDFIVRNPSKVDVREIWKRLKKLVKDVEVKAKLITKCRKTDAPLRSVLGMIGWNHASTVDRAIEFHQYDLQNGVAADVLSSNHHLATSDSVDATITDLKGLEYILKYLIEPFREKVILNTMVSEIRQSASGVTVTTTEGIKYTADHVLITFSPGVLNSNIVKFSPALPTWKTDALFLRPMSYKCKIYFQFPLRFWDYTNHILFIQKDFDHAHYTHWEYFDKNNDISMDRTLLLQMTGDQCIASEAMSNDEVIGKAMKSLRMMYGDNIPSPKGILRSSWSKSNMTLGAQSYPVVAFTNGDLERLRAPVDRIWFAGEYISKEVGSVSSAYDSGKRASKEILTCIKSQQCQVWKQKCQ